MSTYKWFLLIVSLVVVLNMDTAISNAFCIPCMLAAGVYCQYVCEPPSDSALCFVSYEAKLNVMIGRRNVSTRNEFSPWQFYPVNYQGDILELITDPNSICGRIFEASDHKEKNMCVSKKEESYERYIYSDEEYKRYLTARMEQAVDQALRRYNSALTKRGTPRHETDVQRMTNLMREVKEIVKMTEGLVHLDYEALPLTVTTYTSQEWANATATLTIIRDDAERDEQPDLVQLVQALDKVLPILNAVTITSEKRRSLGNGQPTKEEKEDISESRMEEVTGKTARNDAELPDDLKKEAEELRRAIFSFQKAESKFKPDLNLIKEFLDASDLDFGEQFPNAGYPGISSQAGGSQSGNSKSSRYSGIDSEVILSKEIKDLFRDITKGTEGGASPYPILPPSSSIIPLPSPIIPLPFPSSPSKDVNFTFKQPLEVCQYARNYLCAQTDVMVYASDNKFCLDSYKNYTICHRPSMNCFRDLYDMIQYIKIY